VLVSAPLCAHGQWLNQPDPRTPRTRDGKPNLSAPAPRVHSKPDLSGIWQAESTPRKILATMFPPGVGLLPGGENGLGEDDPQKYFLNVLADFKPGEEPLTPAAAALFRERMQSGKKPMTLCEPATVPVTELLPAPFKIVQTPGLMLGFTKATRSFGRFTRTAASIRWILNQAGWATPSVGGKAIGSWST